MHYPTPKVKRLAETLVLEWRGKAMFSRSGEGNNTVGKLLHLMEQ